MARSSKTIFGLFLVTLVQNALAAPMAFPHAEGFGASTPGGRGGTVILVTNLNDNGPGSLRAAVNTNRPRIIVFRVSGTIELASNLEIKEPCVTIAGQSAPGGGICLKNYSCVIKTHDCILRHLRFRPGDLMKKEMDSLSVSGGANIIIDHCSASWGIDETLSVTNSDNVTVQWSLITESLNKSYHKKGEHGYGSLITSRTGGISFHHNLYFAHRSRSPRPGGYEDSTGMRFDFRNNVIANWRDTAGYNSATPLKMNYVANYLKPGPSTKPARHDLAFVIGGTRTKLFIADNVLEGNPRNSRNNELLLGLTNNFQFPLGFTPKDAMVKIPFDAPLVRTEPALSAYTSVLAKAGATRPARDAVDSRIVDEVRSGRGAIIDSQFQVGGWPALATGDPLPDADADGMPDAWERQHGLDPSNPDDQRQDADGDGYVNLEEFLNGSDQDQ